MYDAWEKIRDKAIGLKIIGNVLRLKCQRHGEETEIKSYKDFANCPEGGCSKRCGKIKRCGHACEKACHNFECNNDICIKPCNKLNPNCVLGEHKCKKICSEKYGKCMEKVTIKLKCGHEFECECWETREKDILCHKPCKKILKCGHKCKLEYFEICESIKCMELVTRKLSCKHIIEVPCYLPKYEILCLEKCNSILPCGHICNGLVENV